MKQPTSAAGPAMGAMGRSIEDHASHHARAVYLVLYLFLPAIVPAVAIDSYVQNSEERLRIEQALPPKAVVTPTKARRLLIFTRNVGYGGHPSMAYANEAFTLMGKKTGAFETVVSADPEVFQADSLRRFDAVFFNNTVGNCFTNADLRRNLLEFITGVGGLLGVHGTTVAFTHWPGAIEDWPEFGYLIGARGANHKDSTEHVWIRLDEPEHPLNQVFAGQGFDYRDEFFRVQGTYSRNRVRVLLSIDTQKTDVTQGQPRGDCYRADNDYALAWVRNYGRGRIFYSTIAHNPYVFWEPKLLEFYLAAIQFALGDLAAPTTPSGKLTPAIRAQEKLGWRVELQANASARLTFFEAIEKAAALAVPYVGGCSQQLVSEPVPKHFDPELTDSELSQIRIKLELAGLRLLTYRLDRIPRDEGQCRKLFEFGRKMGIETFVAPVQPDALERMAGFCDEYGIALALTNGERPDSGRASHPRDLLKLCAGRSERIGVCANLGDWRQARIDAIQGVGVLGSRLKLIEMYELRADQATDRLLGELQRRHVPLVFALDYGAEAASAMPRLAQDLEVFNADSLRLVH